MRKLFTRKKTAVFLTTALLTGSIVACGNQPKEVETGSKKEDTQKAGNTQNGASTMQEGSSQTVSKEPVKINFMKLSYTSSVEDDLESVQREINAYIEPKIGVSVNITGSSKEKGGDLTLALASGSDLDLFWVSKGQSGEELMKKEGAYDVTDLLPKYPDIYNQLPVTVWEASRFNGRNFYIPMPKEVAVGYSMCCNKDFVDKYGWDLTKINKLSDFTPLLKQLKEDGIEYPWLNHVYVYPRIGQDDFATIKDYIGVERAGDTKKIVSIYETDKYREYVKLKYEWNQAGYINQAEIDQLQSTTINELHNTGKIGFYCAATVPGLKEAQSSKMPYEVEVVNLSKNYTDTHSAFGSAYMINAKADAETAEACMKFLNIIFNDEKVANLLTYGIEGQHYDLIDGKISIRKDSKYRVPGRWAITSFKSTTPLVSDMDNLKPAYEDFNNKAEVSCTSGFLFDETSVSAEIAACDAVVQEYRLLLEKGFYNPEEYLPVMIKALKNAGLDKIVSEAQSQYDKWLSSK